MEDIQKYIPEIVSGRKTMTRDFCARCAIKHLGKAKILMDEHCLGYPHHVWYAMANMSEAEDELLTLLPDLAVKVRSKRIKLEQSLHNQTQLEVPPFTELMYEIAYAALLPEVEVKK
jgi:hypothetical protein